MNGVRLGSVLDAPSLEHVAVLTTNREIQYIWLKPRTLFTAYWVVVRYLPLVARALGVIGAGSSSCRI